MKTIGLEYMKELQGKSVGAEAREAQVILDEATVGITLDEMKQLQETLSRENQEILDKSTVCITLDEMKKLQETPSRKNQEILDKATVYINLEQVKELQEQAKAREITNNRVDALLGESSNNPTMAAKEAQAILDKATVVITLDEMKELQEQAKAREEIKAGEETKVRVAALLGESGNIPTEAARQAQAILDKATISITSEELKNLPEQDQAILNDKDIAIGLGKAPEKTLFSSTEIGRATLEQQRNTTEKQIEIATRNELGKKRISVRDLL